MSVTVERILYLQTPSLPKTPIGADVTTDTDLDTAGKPADAKAVGDKIGDIASALDAINGEVI